MTSILIHVCIRLVNSQVLQYSVVETLLHQTCKAEESILQDLKHLNHSLQNL